VKAAAKARSKPSVGAGADNVVAGVKISNPDKELYPEAKITKLELARYYEAVGPWIVPQVEQRPLTLVRCPNGWDKKCFFQKHIDAKASSALGRVTVQERDGPAEYMMASSVEAVVTTLQMGALELHPSGARAENLECPDRIVLDFDPDEKLPWAELVTAVTSMRSLLDKLGLVSFLKTTGGKGLHVVIPIEPTVIWDNVKGFSKALADAFTKTFPDRYLSTMSKAARSGKIFIDYLRNDSSATAIAAYSLRARRNAPVAMPLSWDELREDVRGEHFNVRSALTRLARQKKDPWAELTTLRQSLTEEMMDKVGFEPVAKAAPRKERRRK
jgi:bifunctional non-homologous end joining protein LigD